MDFSLDKSIEILERTPETLNFLLQQLSDDWVFRNEGGETWNVYDVVGHLIHCEKTDWIIRAEIILSGNDDKKFEPFDRFAHLQANEGQTLTQLLTEFKVLRIQNLEQLMSKKITIDDLNKIGIHPVFGEVTLQQLLATWVVHDLNHIAQISRVMAKQYKEVVGPWINYLRILQS